MEIQRYIRYGLSLSLTLIFLLHVAGVATLPVLKNLDNQAYDVRLNLTLPENVEKQVVIVDIDEKSLAVIGRWPWNRDVMAKILDQLFDHYKIKEIGFDIVFAEADIDEGGRLLEEMSKGVLKNNTAFQKEYKKVMKSLQRDIIFAESLEGRKTIMGFVMDINTAVGKLPQPVAELDRESLDKLSFIKPKGYTANLDIFQEKAYSGGFFDNPMIDDDGVFRRVPLVQEYDGKLYESFALALARTALGSPRIELVVESSDDNSTLFMEGINIGEIHIPVDDKTGALVPYIGLQKSFDYIPAIDVLNKTIDISRLENKIAIFGTSATGLLDMRTTPLDTLFPGVEIHANIVQGILDQRIMQMPGYGATLEILMLFILGVSLTFIIPLLSPLFGLSVSIATVLLIIGLNLYAWSNQTVLPIASPIFLTILIFILNMTYGFFIESRGKRHLAKLFGQYIPPELVNEMSESIAEINLEGEMREMSVLFSDVRGFTSISENMEPEELTKFINAFLTPITGIIHRERGTIDKYMGDAVMAFWGAPLKDDHHALNAMTAAVKMIERMEALTSEFEAKGWPPIKVGVGVNTGRMNVGNKGSEFRVDYTILGDAVNLGSRLEGLTKNYGVDIIVGESTKHAVPEFEYRELDRVRVKGKLDSVSIYEPICLLTELDDATDKKLRKYHRAVKYYREQAWDNAERDFLELSSLDKECKIYQIYLDRILEYREEPPEENWDGCFTHTSK